MKYFIGTQQEYSALNVAISTARKYKDGVTERYAPEFPELTEDGKCILPVMEKLLTLYPVLFEGVVLFDNISDYIPLLILPDMTWLKTAIQEYMTGKGIEWKTAWTKEQLIEAINTYYGSN